MIQSMTAFARVQKQSDWGSVSWEVRTVNHRYLEVSFRMPEMLRELESELRKLAAASLGRGKVECHLSFNASKEMKSQANINHSLLQAILDGYQQVASATEQRGHPRPMELLRWPGILNVEEQWDDEIKAVIIDAFNLCLQDLVSTRENEGLALKTLLEQRINAIKDELLQLRPLLTDLVAKQRQKIIERFNQLQLEVDNQRLEQEVVLLAQKADVNEEVDRLDTHLTEVSRLLSGTKVMGRRLDFLMQELNREANTLASKANEPGVSSIAVNIKVLIEQMREQIQNIE